MPMQKNRAVLFCLWTVKCHSQLKSGCWLEAVAKWNGFQLFTPAALLVVIVQSLSCVWLFVTPWTAAHQASLSFTISLNLLKLVSIESVMLGGEENPLSPRFWIGVWGLHAHTYVKTRYMHTCHTCTHSVWFTGIFQVGIHDCQLGGARSSGG